MNGGIAMRDAMEWTQDSFVHGGYGVGGHPAGGNTTSTHHETQNLWLVHTPSRYERWGKPVLDRVGAVVLCVLVAPVMLVIVLAVFARLGSPVMLRQRRIGLGGAPFVMYKFRTMHPDRRHAASSATREGADRRVSHKRADDPRLVPLGRFLRRWSLDELPQLFNVVLGHMSLVGPRPELEFVVRRYQPWQHARHQVKPGVTGRWQTCARGRGEMFEHTELDLEYIRTLGLASDLKLLLRTVPAALGSCKGH
jgi:lipopolysaccharide/colanic/teichoic acid biosynthesis glycosyltransferase